MIPVLNTILDSVVDTVVPPTPAFENFIYHWEKFMVNYLEWTADGKCSQTHIDQTNVPGHLEIVQQIILSEDKNEEITTNTIIMEYILKNNLFSVLAAMAEKERLIGTRILILKFMMNLICQLRNPVIAHQSVFGPIQKLINLCDCVSNNKWQQEQIHFLYTLCMLINDQQNVSIMFFSHETDICQNKESEVPRNLSTDRINIMDCVLSYIHTKNTEVYCKCCDCILILCKLNDENVISSIIKKTNLCVTLSTHLRNLFCALPTSLDYNGLEAIELNWRDDYNATYSNDVTKFFCWLDFIIEIIKDGDLKISCYFCETLRFLFMNKLFDTSEGISSSNVFLLKKIYKAAIDTPLNFTINNWLRSELDSPYYNKQTPIDILITLSSNRDDIFVFQVLNFFTEVLHSSDKEMLDFMILRFVNGRNYSERITSGSWSDEEDEREKKLLSNENNINTSRTLAPSSIDRIINRLLALIPQNLQSDPLHTFKDYITNTKNTYEDIFIKCKKFNWPSEALDSAQLNDFSEGPFLQMIFRNISKIPNQNLSITWQLKNILIFLSYLPHPYLHEYLLNSTLPLKRNVSSVYTVLYQVLKELHRQVLMIPNYNDELTNARKQILNSTPKKLLNEKNDKVILFASTVLVEELCKELVAVLFVKYHHSDSVKKNFRQLMLNNFYYKQYAKRTKDLCYLQCFGGFIITSQVGSHDFIIIICERRNNRFMRSIVHKNPTT